MLRSSPLAHSSCAVISRATTFNGRINQHSSLLHHHFIGIKTSTPLLSIPSHQFNTIPHAAVAQNSVAIVKGFWPVLVQAYHADPASLLLSVGACLASIAFSVLLIAAIPALLALRRSALALEQVLHVVHAEIPDTAAAVRLSGLEIADAVEEVSALGSDLTYGIRASARALVDAEQGVRGSIDFASKTLTDVVVPTVKKSIPKTKGTVEGALKERAGLQYSESSIHEVAEATKNAAKRLRTVLGAARVAKSAVGVTRRIRGNRRREPSAIETEITGA